MKFLKWSILVLAVIGLLFFFVIGPYMKGQTKTHSPEKKNTYAQNGFDVSVKYSSPSKKGRTIFGELVPFDAVWRTGANEPTTFTTASAIKIANKDLAKGTYSLWTIPGKKRWTIIFNKDIPDWGVTILSGGKETTRIAAEDVLELEVPVEDTKEIIESFTVGFTDQDQLYMQIAWDRTKVKIPLNN